MVSQLGRRLEDWQVRADSEQTRLDCPITNPRGAELAQSEEERADLKVPSAVLGILRLQALGL